MRILFSCFLFCCTLFSQGQSLKFSAALGDDARNKVWLQGHDLNIRIQGDTEKLELLIKNTSKEYLVVESNDYAIIHDTGINDKLCGEAIKIGPGEKESIVLEKCGVEGTIGLFGLYRHYESQEDFKEGSLFIVDKHFKLRLGDSIIDFYTSR